MMSFCCQEQRQFVKNESLRPGMERLALLQTHACKQASQQPLTVLLGKNLSWEKSHTLVPTWLLPRAYGGDDIGAKNLRAETAS
jgi:hypothetical protein